MTHARYSVAVSMDIYMITKSLARGRKHIASIFIARCSSFGGRQYCICTWTRWCPFQYLEVYGCIARAIYFMSTGYLQYIVVN